VSSPSLAGRVEIGRVARCSVEIGGSSGGLSPLWALVLNPVKDDPGKRALGEARVLGVDHLSNTWGGTKA
jgi:hypothetical protein